MLYVGIKTLHLREAEFWKMTPRTFFALLKCAQQVKEKQQGSPEEEQMVPIDQVGYL